MQTKQVESKYVFESERLGFRRWQRSDHDPFAMMNRNPEVMKYFPKLLTRLESDQLIQRFEEHFEQHGFGLWAVEVKETEEFIGFIGFQTVHLDIDFAPAIEIGWRLNQPFWKKGYAAEGASACLRYGFSQFDFQEICSFTAVLNRSSINVMHKIGLDRVKTFMHPKIEEGNALKEHVLYKMTRHQQVYFDEVIGVEKTAGKTVGARVSVRGVVIRDGKVLMIATNRGDVSFPGGGIDEGETHARALEREMLEETGYETTCVGDYLGQVIYRKIDKFDHSKLYEITTRYFLCQVVDAPVAQKLCASEVALDFKAVWLEPEEAMKHNLLYKQKLPPQDAWSESVNVVLENCCRLIETENHRD